MRGGRVGGAQRKRIHHGIDLRELHAAGLLLRSWPGERVLAGLCVSRWVRKELLEAPDVKEVVLTEDYRRQVPLDGSLLAGSLRRLRNHRITLKFVNNDTASQFHEEDGEGEREQNRHRPWVRGLEEALAREGPSLVDNLVHLDLNPIQGGDLGEGIGPDHWKLLAKVLGSCTRLHTLRLGGQELGAEGITELVPFFQKNTALTDLDLKYNNVRHSIRHLTVCTNLSRLELGGCEEELDDDLADTLEYLTALTDLDLSDVSNFEDGAGVMQALHSHSRLTSLDFSGCVDIDPESAATLAPIISHNAAVLNYLNLGGACMRAEGLALLTRVLSDCSQLATLGLGGNFIKLEGARMLGDVGWEELRQLHTLDLQDNLLLAEGVHTVAHILVSHRDPYVFSFLSPSLKINPSFAWRTLVDAAMLALQAQGVVLSRPPRRH